MKQIGAKNYFKRNSPREERLAVVVPLLHKLYQEEGKLSSYLIDNCSWLPSYSVVRSLFSAPGKHIEPIYDFLGLAVPNTQQKFCNHNKYDLEKVRELYLKRNCILLEDEYISANTPMKYLCSCGAESKNSLHNFKRQERCRRCYNEYHRGENVWNWTGDDKNELSRIRSSKKYKDWRISVFIRDGFTCQCCGDCKGGNLHAHHILNFSAHANLRFELDNGITLCESCHNPSVRGSFHYVYGTKNNNEEQLMEYISLRNGVLHVI
ncbi:HNH endonuclease [Paenibacillus sp. LK1]|uniref:HNH endonuclease n=1 Tax=Paenibacillus sp. LK1 TaxID=2053014 RepID=UPI000F74475E|nr:HNH endonuclease [Paenibacillus sp. LK1]